MITDTAETLVSVVIPTRSRCRLLPRAVRSALSQSLRRIEVIVVIDGPDEATVQAMRNIDDPRLKVTGLGMHVGQACARNIGVAEASGPWIAFLDDDDLWFSKKLEIQMETARRSSWKFPIVSCRLIGRSDKADFILPTRPPAKDQDVSEYLFCRNTLLWGEGLIQSSTLLTSKELMQRIPFREGLRRHVDLDWLLRATRVQGAGIEFASSLEPLVIWHREANRARLSTQFDWRYSLSWLRMNRHLLTPRAYASFALTWITTFAANERDWRAFLPLYREAFRHGKPSGTDIVVSIANWMIPQTMQSMLAALFSRRRNRAAGRFRKSGSHRCA